MDRGGREDRRDSRRRSRSRSFEGRRRRSSGGGSTRGASRRSRSRSTERRRRSDGDGGRDARPRAEPSPAAAQPSPQLAAPPEQPACHTAAPPPEPGPAPTIELVAPSRDNLKLLMATRSDLEALREVERLLVVYNYQHPGSPSLTCLRGLFVRTRYDGYHIRMVNRLLEDGEQCKLLVQVGMALDSRPVVTWELDIKHASSANPLVDPTFSKGGQAELTQLQEELTRLNCALPLQQCAAAVVRRRAALHWWDRYQGEPDLQAFLPRLIADLQDEGDIQRAARRFELLPAAGGAAVQADGAAKAPPPQPEPTAGQPAAGTPPPQPASVQPLSASQQQQQAELSGAAGQPSHESPAERKPAEAPAAQPQQEQQLKQQEEQQQKEQQKQEQQKQKQQRDQSPRGRRRQESLERKPRRESPRKRQRSPDRRQASPDRKQRRSPDRKQGRSPDRRQASPDRNQRRSPDRDRKKQRSPDRRQASPDRKQRRESPTRRQRSPDRRQRKESPARQQRRDSSPQQQPLPSPGDTAASGNHGRKAQDPAAGAAAHELREARKAAKDSHGGHSSPPDANARAAAEQPQARREGSRGREDTATNAAGGKRKRAPIQWQPQQPQPGDRPLMLDGSVPPEQPAKAKLQKAGSGSAREPTPAAAADSKGKQKQILSITVAGPPAGAQPAGDDAELPPGFGGPDLPAAQLPAPAFRAADYAAEGDGGSGNLVVRVRMPHDLPGAAAPMDLAAGGGGATLGGRFDRLNASQRLGSEALQASPSAPFLLTTGGGGAPMPPTAPPPQMLAAASLGAMFDGQQYSGLQQQLNGQQQYSGQQLLPPSQQQYGGQPLQQQHQYGAQPPQQMYSPPGEQFLAMLSGEAVQASVPYGSGSYGDPADRAQSEVVSPSRPPHRARRDGGSEGGDRRVQMERSDSYRGGGGGGGSSGSDAMWCPMTAWETAAVRLLHEQPGITLGEMAGLLPLPPCWSGTFAAYSAYVMRRKQLFNVRPSCTERERSNVYASKGARSFLSFKRRVLQYLADRRPRADVDTLLSNVPTEGLPPHLQNELERNPITFMIKYLGGEIAAVEPPPGMGRARDARLLELRPFPPKAGGSGQPTLAPPFKGICAFYWKKGSCNKGDRCGFAHVPARNFADPPHPALGRGK